MPKFFYAVTATIPPTIPADEYTGWLTNGHVQAVLDAGADSARIVRLDHPQSPPSEPARIETQYVFPSRAAFEAYEAGPAAALRADGKARFADRGVTFERRSGDVLHESPR